MTTNNTIQKEAAVIGTPPPGLRYTRRELLLHYISLPILVTILAAVIGNILGYTVFKGIVADMYYGSYSLPTYETRWNAEAFYLTTLVPFVIMAVINVVLIRGKLKISPLRFLRKDLGSTRRSKAVRLPNFKFFNRFRIRILISEPGQLSDPFHRHCVCQHSASFRYDDEPAPFSLPGGDHQQHAGKIPVYLKCSR